MNLRELARRGALDLLIEMQDETKAILKEFPDLKHLHEARGAMKPRRHGMSAAARKAVSVRMKRYWKNKRTSK